MHPVGPGSLFIQPDLRRKRVQAGQPGAAPCPVRVAIDGTDYSVGGSLPAVMLEMPEFQTWSPDNPYLYTARCVFPETPEAAPIEVRFGMRECSIKDNRILVNNKPLLLRGVVLGVADAAACHTTESARGFIAPLKKAGINFLRVRGGPAPGPLLDAADELGMLICDELDGDAGAAQIESAIVARRNHPSIVMWHVRGGNDCESALRRIHGLDPSRIVVSGLDRLDASARYMRPYQDEIGPLDAVTAHLPLPCPGRTVHYYEQLGEPNMLVLLASFGTPPGECADVNLRSAALDRQLAAHELSGIFPSAAKLDAAIDAARAEAIALQVQAVRVSAKIAGYCIGGTPPANSTALGHVQSPMTLAIRASRTNLVPREEVPVTVTVVNDERTEPIADLSLQVVGPTNQVLWKKKRSLKVPKQTREVWTGTISASGSVGVHKFVVRLMQGMKLLAQNAIDLHVVEPAQPCDIEVAVVDPHAEWTERCTALAVAAGTKPRLYIVPPLANTVRAYPENELIDLLNEVRAGAVALVFAPPADWNDLAERIDNGLTATSVNAAAAYHYVRLHPIFDGLPTRCLMQQPYRNVVPRQSFEDPSDERVCGSVDPNPASGEPWWGEDILVRRFGSGRVVFTHARILEHLGTDPVASRMYVNLLRHFGRRSVPGEVTQPVQQTVLDWLRRERAERARLWCLTGPFANWEGAGHDAKYPPEHQVDLNAVHAGWRDPVRWSRWYAIGEVRNEIDFDNALGLPFSGPASALPETFYAYAECNAPARQPATLRFRTHASVKFFVNGAECHERNAGPDENDSVEEAVSMTLKQGKNAILLKLSRRHCPAQIALEFLSATRDPLIFKWWR